MDSVNDSPIETVTTVASFDQSTYAHIQIKAPKLTGKRCEAAVICVLDISGSMDLEATQAGKAQSDGFTRLDLVKHSVNTIIHSLDDGDFLGIVTFSTKGRIDLKMTEMNKNGKDKALNVVSAMKTEGCTNLWDGIKNGLDLSKDKICQNKNTFVVVLSDGEPNEHPPQGELQTTRNYIKEHPLTCSMSMFGYGYNLNTKLLSALTELGGGSYGFIPDCSFVGTIFVNFLSLILSAFSPRMSIEAQSQHSEVLEVNGIKSSIANLGPVQFGVKRNALIKLRTPPGVQNVCNVKIKYGATLRSSLDIKIKNQEAINSNNIRTQFFRYEHMRILHHATLNAHQELDNVTKQLKNHYEKMKAFYEQTGKENEFLNALMRDIQSKKEQQGQVGLALSKQDYWNKWGIHYLPALKIAHELEFCTNFKDPGLQMYGGELFESMQDKIDTIFIKLPPPQPSIKKYDQQGNLHVVHDMADYYDEYGGCIDGQCLVSMSNGEKKLIKHIKSGDEIITDKNQIAKVKCVIKTPVNQIRDMVKFKSGLIITKYHPIIFEGSWRFPVDVEKVEPHYVEAYYNFILDQGHMMLINGISCITLGHGFKEDVAQHQFLGTEKVIEDLSKFQGWRQGNVVVQSSMFKRDPASKQIIGIY